MKTVSDGIKRFFSTILMIIMVIGAFSYSQALAARGSGTSLLPLSSTEADMLNYMREEEKLARDVYLNMYSQWSAVTFSNISVSEQQHMDTMKKMLDKYNLVDPALPAIGQFTNTTLQEKYNQLMASGSQSYINGLNVGATIEEIDMIDIQHAISVTTHLDVVTAYQNLLEGSKSHLRSYVKALEFQGVIYSPQFISQELYDAIMGF